MSEEHTDPAPKEETALGLFSRVAPEGGLQPGDLVAVAVSLLWLALVGGFFLFADTGEGGGPLGSIMVLVAIFAPLALIWIAAITLRMSREVREETRRLQATVDAMRHAYINQTQAGLNRSAVEKRLDEIAAAAKHTETALTHMAARRPTERVPPSADHKAALVGPKLAPVTEEQPALALGSTGEEGREPISVSDFLKAMNFPDSQNDKDGFRALRRALEDRTTSKLVRAAQDALTLLSQDGIYMDDLRPERAKPEVWRRFAQGERGRPVAALGGVRDRSSLALTSGRMKQDTIFRDTSHHFLRQFDKTFQEFEKNASDQEIAALAETRTARAFMLLGRVNGIFD
jgi:hypothetical protein